MSLAMVRLDKGLIKPMKSLTTVCPLASVGALPRTALLFKATLSGVASKTRERRQTFVALIF